MVFSMGEAVPCAHYGKKAGCPEAAGARTLTCRDGVSRRGSRKCRERVGGRAAASCAPCRAPGHALRPVSAERRGGRAALGHGGAAAGSLHQPAPGAQPAPARWGHAGGGWPARAPGLAPAPSHLPAVSPQPPSRTSSWPPWASTPTSRSSPRSCCCSSTEGVRPRGVRGATPMSWDPVSWDLVTPVSPQGDSGPNTRTS